MIYRHFRNSSLSSSEIRTLIDCGIVGFGHQNVPLWRWLSQSDDAPGDPWSRVNILAMLGNETEKRFAIKILELAAQPIPSLNGTLDANRVLRGWLSDDGPSQVFDAAISYLSTNSTKADLPMIEEASSNCAPPLRKKIDQAIVTILSRNDVTGALMRIVSSEVDKIEDDVVAILFASPQSLTTPTLQACLSAKSEIVRLKAAQLLSDRNEIPLDTAQALLTDSNYDIRLIAVVNLRRMVPDFTEEVAKNALRIVTPQRSLLGMMRQSDETYYDRYRNICLAELDFEDVRSAVLDAGVFDYRELSVLYTTFPKRMQSDIRSGLKNSFVEHFEKKIEKKKAAGDMPAEHEAQVRDLSAFVRTKICNSALIALCEVGRASDINIFRETIDKIEIFSNIKIIRYLGRFGSWQDIERVAKLGKDYGSRVSLLSYGTDRIADEKAKAIISLGKDRIADLLSIDLQNDVRFSLVKHLSKSIIAGLNDEILLREFGRDIDEYRVIFALKCIQSLPRNRCKKLLDQYVDGNSHRFYNAIHWLDLGASFPTSSARSIAARAISKR